MEHLGFEGTLFAVALSLGGVLGSLFGELQAAALARNRKLKDAGKLRNGWLVMPGSFGRVAAFLVFLMLVQVLLPFVFAGEAKWLVSLGIIFGYGWTHLKKVKKHAEGIV